MRKLILFCLLSLWSTWSYAEIERHALIIGNSNYARLALENPINDAKDMAEQLAKMGYKIHGGGPALDLDRTGIERTVRAFASQLPDDAHALLYYAGHGIATETDNYLIPVKHELENEGQLKYKAVSLRDLVGVLRAGNSNGINVVLLDACRDNPLPQSTRSSQEGLSRLNDIPRGVFIGYAADFGQVAADGLGRNGTYTAELLGVLREQPNVIIEIAHKEVASRVYEKTGGQQFPVSENKVYGNWCFGQCADPVVTAKPAIAAPSDAPETQAGSTIKKSNNRWLIVGGAVAAAGGVGLVASRGDSSGASEGDGFTLIINPP